MWLSRSKLSVVGLGLLVIGLATAQNSAQRQSVDVRRVGHHLACKCGCPDTVATCAMLECSFSNPAKQKIFDMERSGVSDQVVIDSFIKEYGDGIYRADPNSFGWIIPYSALAIGVLVIVWFVRRYYKPGTAAAPEASSLPPEALDRYRDQIEQDMAHLD